MVEGAELLNFNKLKEEFKFAYDARIKPLLCPSCGKTTCITISYICRNECVYGINSNTAKAWGVGRSAQCLQSNGVCKCSLSFLEYHIYKRYFGGMIGSEKNKLLPAVLQEKMMRRIDDGQLIWRHGIKDRIKLLSIYIQSPMYSKSLTKPYLLEDSLFTL